MTFAPDKRSEELEYSSFSVFESALPPTAMESNDKTSQQQSSLPPSGYTTILRTAPRTISSIEQFDFKSVPEQTGHHKNTTVTTSSGLTNMSSFTTDTTALMYQSKNDDTNNTFVLQSLPTATNATATTNATTLTDDSVTDIDTTEERQPSQGKSPLTTRLPSVKASRKNEKRQKNYQAFPGNSVFFCGGRLMTSQAYWAFFIAMVLVIAPSVLFAVFTCPFLWYNIHPVVPIVFAYLFILAVVSMLKTSWTDPGVIPRGLDPTPTLETFDDHSSIWTQPFPADRCVKIKDEMWNLKYCPTCNIYRPPRASHCRQCDNCVENEDHHCIWLNNCIGKRNYRHFFTFITICSLMAIYMIIFTVLHLLMAAKQIQPDINFNLVFNTAPVSFVLAIVGFFLLWMVGGLTTYHCHLVWKGVTTHEKLRSTPWDTEQPAHPNPYGEQNPIMNIIQILCRPQPKSHLRRRKYLDTP